MRKQNVTATKTVSQKKKTTSARLSNFKPTSEELSKAMAVKLAMSKDAALIKSLKLEEEQDKFKPIVFSDTWYEWSVLAQKLHVHPKTLGKWLKNGWLAYSAVGKICIINKADLEEMLLQFRKPSIWMLIGIIQIFGELLEVTTFE